MVTAIFKANREYTWEYILSAIPDGNMISYWLEYYFDWLGGNKYKPKDDKDFIIL